MLPHATFYLFGTLVESSVLAHGKFEIDFEQQSENFLDVSLNVNNTQPGKEIEINLKSKPKSTVHFLAVDKRISYLDYGNDLESKDFSSSYSDNESGIYTITEIFLNMKPCSREEIEMFYEFSTLEKQSVQSSLDSYSFRDSINNLDHIDVEESDEVIDLTTIVPRENFPETWFFETVHMGTNSQMSIDKVIPDSITTWIISAFAMNNNHGFALAKKQELVVSRNFFISLNLPYIARIGEIIDVEVLIFNFIKGRIIDVDVTLKVDELEIVNKRSDGLACTFSSLPVKQQTKLITTFPGSGKKVTFQVRTALPKNHTLLVSASGRAKGVNLYYADVVKEKLAFELSGVQSFSYVSEIVHRDSNDSFHYTHINSAEDAEDKCTSRTIELFPDTISKSLHHNEKYNHMLEMCGEQTAAKFSKMAIIYNYLKNVRKNHKSAEVVKKKLDAIYQKVLRFFHEDGYYKLWFKNEETDEVWLTAYAVSILGQAMNMGIVAENPEIIKKALRYIDRHKNPINMRASVLYNWVKYSSYYKLPCGFQKAKDGGKIRYWLTTSAMLAFLQNKERIGDEFNETIKRGMLYLQTYIVNFDACSTAAAAYAFSLYNEQYANSIISNLKGRKMGRHFAYIFDDENIAGEANIFISSYVVWTLLKLNRTVEAEPIVSWITEKRNLDGRFNEPYDTAIALWALVQYATQFTETNSQFNVNVLKSETQKVLDQASVSNNNPFVKEYEAETNIELKGYGKGYLHINDICELYTSSGKYSTHLNLRVNTSLQGDKGEIGVCLNLDNGSPNEDDNCFTNEMMMVEIQLQSGFIFDADFNKEFSNVFGEQKILKEIQTRRKNTQVFLYLQRDDAMEDPAYDCVRIKVMRTSIANNLALGYVKAYCYSLPDKFNLEPYTFHPEC